MTQVIHRFNNPDEGVTSEVAKISLGFSVVLRDDDSGQVLPEARIFQDESLAIRHAKYIANISGVAHKIAGSY